MCASCIRNSTPASANTSGWCERKAQRGDRIGALPGERRAPVLRQRLRQHEQAVAEVGQREPAATQNGARVPTSPSTPPIAGAMHEADAEGHADLAEGGGALFRRRDVGDVGVGGGEAGAGDARQHAADEQQRQRLRHRHQDEVQAQAEVGQQDHRPPAEAVRQRALDRREHELHDHEHGRRTCRASTAARDTSPS